MPADEAPAQDLPRLHPRHEQMFPVLSTDDISRMQRFGESRSFAEGDMLYTAGKAAPGLFVLLSGKVAISARDGLGHRQLIVEQGPGQFLAETGQLADSRALVDGQASTAVETLLIAPDRLRELIVAEADLGERMLRALILRTVNLLQSGAGPALLGLADGREMARLREFLRRNAVPYSVLDPAVSVEAAELLARHPGGAEAGPLVICPDGTVLRSPSNLLLARSLGMTMRRGGGQLFDVAIVGAGPAGLATAVYAASEGLGVALLDACSFGGQAGASARIENYFGFPTGISGEALVGRAFVQARKFGAEIYIPAVVSALDCSSGEGMLRLEFEEDAPLLAKTVVVASGARYRRPAIRDLARFEGCGVWYWASASEIRLCAGEEVVVVGGGNSAGQAAVHLASHVRRVLMLVRGPGLSSSMSRYLIDRIAATPNIEVMPGTEVVGLEGSVALERVQCRSRETATDWTAPIRHLFVFAGAEPSTGWLTSCGLALDPAGFVTTGFDWPESTGANPLQTSIPGVFAVGDVRSGSVKRVGGAIGEGAQVVAALHGYLGSALGTKPAAAPAGLAVLASGAE